MTSVELENLARTVWIPPEEIEIPDEEPG